MHWYHAIGVLLLLLASVSAFSPSAPPLLRSDVHQQRSHVKLMMTSQSNNNNNNPSRRNVLIQSTLMGLSAFLSNASPAYAKKKESEPLTPENVQAAFDALRFELEDPKGGVSIMQNYMDNNDFQGLLEFTKTYDQVLRKQKWGRCKAFLTNNAEKEVATLQGNAVTFDLIGINRSSRSGQESAQQANKYLNELRTDLKKMIDMQSTIRYEADGSFNEYMDAIKGN